MVAIVISFSDKFNISFILVFTSVDYLSSFKFWSVSSRDKNTLKILVREVYDNQGVFVSVYKEKREKEGILDEKIEASL